MLERRGGQRAASLASALLTACLAAGCAGRGADADRYGPELRPVAPDLSLVRLPPPWDARRLAVRREIVDGRLRERVVLANDTVLPSENRIEVETAWRGLGSLPFLRGTDDGKRFTEARVRSVAEKEFGAASVVSPPVEAVNRNGPYAYLTAAFDDGSTCLYAWQTLDRWAALDRTTHAFAVDLRYCAAHEGKEQLLAFFDALDLRPDR